MTENTDRKSLMAKNSAQKEFDDRKLCTERV